MKVITGKAKGRTLEWVKETRPLSQRAKTSLFDILSPYIPNSSVLDLYAGSGGLGIEALSRGAKDAVFVEISKEATEKIQENLMRTGFQDQSEIHQMPAEKYLDRIIRQLESYEKFNLIFIFAPYNKTDNKILEKASRLLDQNGILIAEHHKKFHINTNIPELAYIETRTYGITSLSFFKKIK